MTERLKVADLLQEEREQLLKEAQDAGIKNAMIATWYVDTLKAKIDATKAKKTDGADDTKAPETDEAQKTETQTDKAQETQTDEDQKDDAADTADIDPSKEAQELDKDVEPEAPKTGMSNEVAPAPATKAAAKKAAAATVKICHICRGKVINGKCQDCGFEISKR